MDAELVRRVLFSLMGCAGLAMCILGLTSRFKRSFWISVACMAILSSLASSVVVNAIANQTGGKPLPIITASERAAQEEQQERISAAEEKMQRDDIATNSLMDTHYIKDPRTKPPTCYAQYYHSLSTVNCDSIPQNMLGVARLGQ